MRSGRPRDRAPEEALAALRKSEAQMATIIENLSEGVIAATLEGDVLLWNPAAIAMHGFSSLDECRRMLPEFDTVFESLHADRASRWRSLTGPSAVFWVGSISSESKCSSTGSSPAGLAGSHTRAASCAIRRQSVDGGHNRP